ncbi:MAG: hypothetical protein HKN28_12325 [Alphaproteobacteria bacterium]|nr:hypothetical protein [Alphaproteobacteria bacterium]
MEATEMYVLVAVVIFVCVLMIKFLLRPKPDELFPNIDQKIMPIWATLGPFDTGFDSASAMRGAYLAVMGPTEAKKMGAVIEQHETDYDDNSKEWEETRRKALEVADSGTLNLAEAITTSGSSIKGLIVGGERWSEYPAHQAQVKSLISTIFGTGEAFDENSKQDNGIITPSIGMALINDHSTEALDLFKFLCGVYRLNMNKEPNGKAIDMTCLAFLAMRNEQPDSKLLDTFDNLIGSYSKSLSDKDYVAPEENADDIEALNEGDRNYVGERMIANPVRQQEELCWSERPGAYEQHLKRKYNNPLFPIDERIITQTQIDEAFQKDKQDRDALQADIENILDAVQRLSKEAQTRNLADLRKTLDDLLVRSIEIGAKQILPIELDKLRARLIDKLRKAFESDPEALEKINTAEKYHQSYWARFVAQYKQTDNPIRLEEFVPALLEEEPGAIEVFGKVVSYDVSKQIFQFACDLLAQNENVRITVPGINRKLDALEKGMLASRTAEQEK